MFSASHRSSPASREPGITPRPGPLREIAGAVPTPHGLIEVRITGADAEIDRPVPAVVVRENGSEIELDAGTNNVTVR
jgi:alpha-L-rhamnosidase